MLVGMHKRPIQHQLYYSIVGTSGILRRHIPRHLNVRILFQFQMPQGHGQDRRLVMYVLTKLPPETTIAAPVRFQKRNMSKGMKWGRH